MSQSTFDIPAGRKVETRVARFLVDLVGYGLASVLALVCDYGLLLLLTRDGLPYLLASFLSFTLGMAVSYGLCIRFVFADRSREVRREQAAGFFVIGFLGLALTQVLLYVFVSKWHFAVAAAKVPTVAIVFFFNFLCRRTLVFNKRPRHLAAVDEF